MVVLPQPEGPSRLTNSPLSNERSTPLTTWLPPKLAGGLGLDRDVLHRRAEIELFRQAAGGFGRQRLVDELRCCVLLRRALDQMQAGIGRPGAFLGHDEADRQALVGEIPGADVEMRADDRLAALIGVGRGARGIEEQRGLEFLDLLEGRGQIAGRMAPDLRQEHHEGHARGIRRRGDGDGVLELRLPEIVPGGRRGLDLLGVVGEPQRIIAGADRIGGRAVLVDRFWQGIGEIGDRRRVEAIGHLRGEGELADAAIHPGDVDRRRGLLLLQLRQSDGRGADLGVDGDTGRLGEGLGDASLEGVAPIAAIPGDGDRRRLLRQGRRGEQGGGKHGRGQPDGTGHRRSPLPSVFALL
jgi:hypothetical protein